MPLFIDVAGTPARAWALRFLMHVRALNFKAGHLGWEVGRFDFRLRGMTCVG